MVTSWLWRLGKGLPHWRKWFSDGKYHGHGMAPVASPTIRLADLPWQGQLVELQVQVPRLRCNHASCPQVIFAELVPAVMLPRARRTVRPREALTSLGL